MHSSDTEYKDEDSIRVSWCSHSSTYRSLQNLHEVEAMVLLAEDTGDGAQVRRDMWKMRSMEVKQPAKEGINDNAGK